MNLKNLVFVLIISLFFSGCSKETSIINNETTLKIVKQEKMEERKVLMDDKGIIYVNNDLGFSLCFPISWKDKFFIIENNEDVSIIHYAPKAVIPGCFFIIEKFGSVEDWDEWEKTVGEGNIFKKIGVIDDNVFVYNTIPDDFYSGDENEKKYLDEWNEMKESVGLIIESFKEANDFKK